MRKIIWSPKARADFEKQITYIAGQNVQNAVLVQSRVDASAKNLASVPTGRAGRVFGTYESPVLKTSLILVYELTDPQTLNIVRLIHGARNWQAGKWPEED